MTLANNQLQKKQQLLEMRLQDLEQQNHNLRQQLQTREKQMIGIESRLKKVERNMLQKFAAVAKTTTRKLPNQQINSQGRTFKQTSNGFWYDWLYWILAIIFIAIFAGIYTWMKHKNKEGFDLKAFFHAKSESDEAGVEQDVKSYKRALATETGILDENDPTIVGVRKNISTEEDRHGDDKIKTSTSEENTTPTATYNDLNTTKPQQHTTITDEDIEINPDRQFAEPDVSQKPTTQIDETASAAIHKSVVSEIEKTAYVGEQNTTDKMMEYNLENDVEEKNEETIPEQTQTISDAEPTDQQPESSTESKVEAEGMEFNLEDIKTTDETPASEQTQTISDAEPTDQQPESSTESKVEAEGMEFNLEDIKTTDGTPASEQTQTISDAEPTDQQPESSTESETVEFNLEDVTASEKETPNEVESSETDSEATQSSAKNDHSLEFDLSDLEHTLAEEQKDTLDKFKTTIFRSGV